MNKEELFSYFPNTTVKRYERAMKAFGSLDVLWSSNQTTLEKVWDKKTSHDFIVWRNCFDSAQAETVLQRNDIICLHYTHPHYPALLKTIYDPPYALFIRGTLAELRYLAVVGTRKATQYGYDVVNALVPNVAAQTIGIISGLAMGIDSAAHEAALSVKGTTIAVLGSGVDDNNITPQISWRLAQTILDNGGALVSEYPPGTPATHYSFATRNRIIAGLAQATLVIEAPEKSGALITASCALDNGRDVLSVPHPLFSESGKGCNQLIKQGALVILSSETILEYFGLLSTPKNKTQNTWVTLSIEEQAIMRLLSHEKMTSDQLARQLQKPISQISSWLTQLELKSFIKHSDGTSYTIV